MLLRAAPILPWLLAGLGFLSLVAAQGYDFGRDISVLVKRQLPGRVVVTGAPRVNGTTPFRPEIRDLQEDSHKWTLYILALSLMQYMDQRDEMSWYGLAGIHGVPWTEWNGVPATHGNEKNGYCMHATPLFPPWHRPYLALYEQTMVTVVQAIATLFPDNAGNSSRSQFERAAADFRIPYLDWAAKPGAAQAVLPPSVGAEPTMWVDGPAGRQRIANPLYSYLFKPLNSSMFLQPPYTLYLSTMRAPTTNDSLSESNGTQVAMTLTQALPNFQQRLYNLFSNYKNYTTFSTSMWIPDQNDPAFDSVESLHDTIHSLSGLNGHMAYVPFSAFDPLFFLHHTMVDRVFAMWQVLNPDAWIVPTPAGMPSFTYSQGQYLNSSFPLAPFYASSNGTFWTADTVRDPTVFGYTYSEVAGATFHPTGRPSDLSQARVAGAINSLYSGSSPASIAFEHMQAKKRREERKNHNEKEVDIATSPLGPRPRARYHSVRSAAKGVLTPDNRYREWVVNIHAEKMALGGTFFVHFFLDDPPTTTDARSWAYAPNLVGTMSVWATPRNIMMLSMMGDPAHPNGDAVKSMDALVISGTVPLTSFLAGQVAMGMLPNMNVDTIQPFLRSRLRFRVVTVEGEVVGPEKVGGFGMKVASSVVKAPASESELPVWPEAPDFEFDLI